VGNVCSTSALVVLSWYDVKRCIGVLCVLHSSVRCTNGLLSLFRLFTPSSFGLIIGNKNLYFSLLNHSQKLDFSVVYLHCVSSIKFIPIFMRPSLSCNKMSRSSWLVMSPYSDLSQYGASLKLSYAVKGAKATVHDLFKALLCYLVGWPLPCSKSRQGTEYRGR
jgi:hypothetical protein